MELPDCAAQDCLVTQLIFVSILSIASKGSGAQRALFLALMQYISKNSKEHVIWGVDEPEAFLQPKLQKKVADVFSDIIKNQNQTIIYTTHSQHFIDLKNLESTYLFKGKQEIKEYTRRPERKFVEMNTSPLQTSSTFEKASLIKEHLGINSNDGWEIMPYNILVEGEGDKKYLEAIFCASTIPTPNIIWAGGASKIGGYLQFYNNLAKDLNYKPIIVCLFDNDKEGKEQTNKVKQKSLSNIKIHKFFPPRFDGIISDPNKPNPKEWEIEDFLPPDLVIKSINIILKNEGYKLISQKQQNDRKQIANIDKGILRYAKECVDSNNPDKESLPIDNEGIKKQICMKICEILKNEKWDLTDQIRFLNEITAVEK
jgi:predicted ATP-dependent endonuclease of OLD family